MNANLSKFLEQLSVDKNIAFEFFQKQDLKNQYEFALAHSEGGFSEKELQESLDMMEVCFNELQKGELSENDLEKVAGGDPETSLRSVAMMIPALVQLVLNGGELMANYFAIRKRYENEQDKLRITELEGKIKEMEAAAKAAQAIPEIPIQ